MNEYPYDESNDHVALERDIGRKIYRLVVYQSAVRNF
jgi:hypothetical protein